jgi:hypothetical protein
LIFIHLQDYPKAEKITRVIMGATGFSNSLDMKEIWNVDTREEPGAYYLHTYKLFFELYIV